MQGRYVNRPTEIVQEKLAAGRFDDAKLECAERDETRDSQAESHIIIYADHVGAQALIDRAHAGPGNAGAVTSVCCAVIVGHRNLFSLLARQRTPTWSARRAPR